MSDTKTAVSGPVTDQEMGLATLSPQGLAIWDAMISTVPDSEGAGVENILETIATAPDLNHLDAPWWDARAAGLLNVPIIINSVTKSPSDFDGGTGYYMVIRAARADTGEAVTLISGSTSVVFQLAQACALEATNPGKVFPFRAILRQSKRPTAAGYYPQHLEIVR